MGFTDAIRTCLRKYVTFSGRASRPEYWWFVLFIILGGIVAGVIDGMLFAGSADLTVSPTGVAASSDGPVSALFSLGTLLPALAAAWRRMHDTGRSGLYVLYPLIAAVGIFTFMGMVAGFDTIASGQLAALFTGAVGIIMAFAVIVLILSPLIVLWWLTRPSQSGPNQWGPNPNEVSR